MRTEERFVALTASDRAVNIMGGTKTNMNPQSDGASVSLRTRTIPISWCAFQERLFRYNGRTRPRSPGFTLTKSASPWSSWSGSNRCCHPARMPNIGQRGTAPSPRRCCRHYQGLRTRTPSVRLSIRAAPNLLACLQFADALPSRSRPIDHALGRSRAHGDPEKATPKPQQAPKRKRLPTPRNGPRSRGLERADALSTSELLQSGILLECGTSVVDAD